MASMVSLAFSASAQSKPYSLPSHRGAVILDLDGFHVTQTSAKPDGREMGVRAHDSGAMEMLSFLFLTPENKSQTAASCLAQDIAQVRKDSGKIQEQPNPFGTDSHDWASVLVTKKDGYQAVYRYAGAGDQCLVIEMYADKGSKLDLAKASAVLGHQRYDPEYAPSLDDAAAYERIRGQRMLDQPAPAKAPKMLVTWYGAGGIPLPASADWHLVLFTAYDNAGRPLAQFHNERTGATVSFLIFENQSGTPSSEGCRKDVMDAIEKGEAKLISGSTTGDMPDGNGSKFATASHFTHLAGKVSNHDVFAFAGSAKTCAEVHASVLSGKPDEDKNLNDALALFHPDLSYQPAWQDYVIQGTLFYKQSPMMGAPFYDAAVKHMPAGTADPEIINARRIATDQIVIALGMSGQVQQARAYAEHAIKLDPDYPLNYYNLACADAEEGKAADAKAHLRQAFDHKANVIQGESMPDPAKDDSILKLRNNKDFWTFVQTLK
jgi:tetratricopeptide (TPR) repeat protein